MLPAQMLFLVLHLVGNAAFTLLVRFARSARFDYATVGTMNYATGALIGGAMLVTADGPVPWTGERQSSSGSTLGPRSTR